MSKTLREDIAGAVARGWCSEKNKNKTMDVDLALAIVDELCLIFHNGDMPEEQSIPTDKCRGCGGLGYTVGMVGQDTHEQTQCRVCRGSGVFYPTFYQELENLINRFSIENGSNTADFVLTEYLMSCLCAFERAIKERDRLAGRTKNFNESEEVV